MKVDNLHPTGITNYFSSLAIHEYFFFIPDEVQEPEFFTRESATNIEKDTTKRSWGCENGGKILVN